MKETIFNGSAGEYFKIWITNLFLTIITFGIYSAWAEVINKKYIYQNITIDGHRFDYVAKPIQILKGRAIGLMLLFLVGILSVFNPMLYVLSLIALFIATPWLINKSLSFRLRMTTYRGVSFDFRGNYKETFLYFMLLPILSIFTLFITLPLFQKFGAEYSINNYSFGQKTFKSKLNAKEFYKAYLFIGIVFFVISSLSGFIFYLFPYAGIVILPLSYIALIVSFSSIWTSIIRNHTFNNSELDGIATFDSKMDIVAYTKILFTNVLALLFSLGLAYPWVAIRNIKYLSNATSSDFNDGVDSVINNSIKNDSAVLDEVAGAFDVQL